MDETLLHAAGEPPFGNCDFRCGPYYVALRPKLHEFLRICAVHFRLAIWSSASADYLDIVLSRALPREIHLDFVWDSRRCIYRFDPEYQEHYPVKDLRKVKRIGYSLDRVLFVDNTPRKLERNYGNAVYVKSFVGAPDDDELPKLATYLVSLANTDNVRVVEKRGWRNRTDD